MFYLAIKTSVPKFEWLPTPDHATFFKLREQAEAVRKEVPDSTGTFKVGDGWAIVKEDTLDGVLGTEPEL
jgi:hypothetical protein